MSRRGLGRLVTFAAVAGAVAAGISYVMQYKSFHKDLEEDFHEFEDDDDYDFEDEPSDSTMSRTYVSLHANKDEFVVAAKDTLEAAKGMAGAAKEMLKDVGKIVTENAHDVGTAAKDTASDLKDKAADKVDDAKEKTDEFVSGIKKSTRIDEEDF